MYSVCFIGNLFITQDLNSAEEKERDLIWNEEILCFLVEGQKSFHCANNVPNLKKFCVFTIQDINHRKVVGTLWTKVYETYVQEKEFGLMMNIRVKIPFKTHGSHGDFRRTIRCIRHTHSKRL